MQPSTAKALLSDFTDLTERTISIIRPPFKLGPVDLSWPKIAAGDHAAYMLYALSLACLSPPTPTNLHVGAVLVDSKTGEIVSTGYTLELEGDTHASQCAIEKLMSFHKVDKKPSVGRRNWVEDLGSRGCRMDLYMTMEPCSRRTDGRESCVSRILGIRPLVNRIYVGIKEAKIWVSENEWGTFAGRKIEVVKVEGMEEEIVAIAKAGHPEEEDREVVLTRTREQNEYLKRINQTLEEENEDMRERAEEIGKEWRCFLKKDMNDSEDSADESGDYLNFVKEPAEEIEAMRAVVRRLKAENEMLREKVGKSAEEMGRDEVERAREENERLKAVNGELGREYEWLMKRVERLEERYS